MFIPLAWLSLSLATAVLPAARPGPEPPPAPHGPPRGGDTVVVDTTKLVPQLHVTQWLNLPDSVPPVRLGDGHVYLLGFTEYWCEGCPLTYGPLMALAQQYAARGVRVILVTSLAGQTLDFIQHYFAAHHVTLPIAIGHKNAAAFHVHSLPTVVLVDGRGSVRQRWTGGLVGDDGQYGAEIAKALDTVLTARR